MSTHQFDEALSRRVEATYTTPDVVEQRRTTLRTLALRPGEDVLDVALLHPGSTSSRCRRSSG